MKFLRRNADAPKRSIEELKASEEKISKIDDLRGGARRRMKSRY